MQSALRGYRGKRGWEVKPAGVLKRSGRTEQEGFERLCQIRLTFLKEEKKRGGWVSPKRCSRLLHIEQERSQNRGDRGCSGETAIQSLNAAGNF